MTTSSNPPRPGAARTLVTLLGAACLALAAQMAGASQVAGGSIGKVGESAGGTPIPRTKSTVTSAPITRTTKPAVKAASGTSR